MYTYIHVLHINNIHVHTLKIRAVIIDYLENKNNLELCVSKHMRYNQKLFLEKNSLPQEFSLLNRNQEETLLSKKTKGQKNCI